MSGFAATRFDSFILPRKIKNPDAVHQDFILRAMKESNPRQRFWRPLFCH